VSFYSAAHQSCNLEQVLSPLLVLVLSSVGGRTLPAKRLALLLDGNCIGQP
jgi:hypothetical protein